MGYEAMREQTLARQKELGIVPADTELPPINPIGTVADAPGPGRQAVPAARVHQALGLALGRREAPVLADGRGLRRVPVARRPPDRPAARLPRGDRRAREHARHPGLGQRRLGRGRPGRLGQREPAVQRDPGQPRRRTWRCSTSSAGTKTYNHYPNGWAMAFNTPFKMWKRYEFNGGTSDPCIISLARQQGGRRPDPDAVPPRDRPRADDPRPPGRRDAGPGSRATSRSRSTA